MGTTNLRASYNTGSGAVVDVVSGVTVQDTRIRALHIVGVGECTVEAQETDPFGAVAISRIRVQVSGTYTQELPDMGVRMNGPVKVSAAGAGMYTTIYYG